jgi:thiamine transport system ATP-binding protein
MLTLEALRVTYGDTVAVDGIDLTVEEGEVVSLLGPSGCGKTTVLRAVAGLVPVAGGRIVLDGREVSRVPPHARPLGLMFQDYALFPHRDVAGNVGFGPRMSGLKRERVAARVNEVLGLVGLRGYEGRSIPSLSGGEQQRVALARALAPEPRLLMLDEPLGSLDRALRERLAVELRDLFVRLGSTAITVTHDQAEAFTVADRVVVMRDGRVVQEGAPVEVWRSPRDAFVADFLGFGNVFDVEVLNGCVSTPWGEVRTARPDGPAALVIRPDGLRFVAEGDTGTRPDEIAPGIAGAAGFRGDYFLVTADVGSWAVEVTERRGIVPARGASVSVALDRAAVLVLDRVP